MKAIKLRAVSLAALFVILAAAILHIAAFAADDGVYLAATNTYYLNPDTGVTDDGGSKNAAIGEGMCRSVIYEKALVEIGGGKVYATVRVQLVSNMGAIKFTVQQKAGDPASYASVSPRVVAEDAGADTADYRFTLPSVSSYIGCSTYVTPMGRDVKFYMNLSSSLTEGSGDFVVSVKPAAASVPEPAEAAREPETAPAPEPAQEAQTIPPAETDAGAPQTLSDTQTPAAEQAPAEAGPATNTVANAADENADEAGANENAAPELADGAHADGETPAEDIGGADVGNAVDSGAATGAVSESERDENPSGGFNGIMVGVIALIVIAVVICAVMVLRKKQRSGKV